MNFLLFFTNQLQFLFSQITEVFTFFRFDRIFMKIVVRFLKIHFSSI